MTDSLVFICRTTGWGGIAFAGAIDAFSPQPDHTNHAFLIAIAALLAFVIAELILIRSRIG